MGNHHLAPKLSLGPHAQVRCGRVLARNCVVTKNIPTTYLRQSIIGVTDDLVGTIRSISSNLPMLEYAWLLCGKMDRNDRHGLGTGRSAGTRIFPAEDTQLPPMADSI